jgi:hypothetical protein
VGQSNLRKNGVSSSDRETVFRVYNLVVTHAGPRLFMDSDDLYELAGLLGQVLLLLDGR